MGANYKGSKQGTFLAETANKWTNMLEQDKLPYFQMAINDTKRYCDEAQTQLNISKSKTPSPVLQMPKLAAIENPIQTSSMLKQLEA